MPRAKKSSRIVRTPSPSTSAEVQDSDVDIDREPEEVISQEVDEFGRNHYQVKWVNWVSEQGSSYSWICETDLGKNFSALAPLVKAWNKKEQRRRNALAQESLEVDLSVLFLRGYNRRATGELLEAVKEKEARARTLDRIRPEEWESLEKEDEAAASKKAGTFDPQGSEKAPARPAPQPMGRAVASGSSSAPSLDQVRRAKQAGKARARPRYTQQTHLPTPASSARTSVRPLSPSPSPPESPSPQNSGAPSRSGSPSFPRDLIFPPEPDGSRGSTSPVKKGPSSSQHLASRAGVGASSSAKKHAPPTLRTPSRSDASGWSSTKKHPPSSQRSDARPVRPLPPSSSSRKTLADKKRKDLGDEWSREAGKSRAATIRFINEVDDKEAIPQLPRNFQYLEASYKLPDTFNDMNELLQGCECEECNDASACNCQEWHEIMLPAPKKGKGKGKAREEQVYAYTEEGYLIENLPSVVPVVECNAKCKCDSESCRNRVAQRPREVDLEVFKTKNCGWGVRAVDTLPAGFVLGIFTGELITRRVANHLSDASYVYDLDRHEDPDEDNEDDDNCWSVNSHECGNWSRFLNHCCEPNMKVFPVEWCKGPELNAYFLAFVTTREIPAREELRIDYLPFDDDSETDPDEEVLAREELRNNYSPSNDGQKANPENLLPSGMVKKQCFCGARRCRGTLGV